MELARITYIYIYDRWFVKRYADFVTPIQAAPGVAQDGITGGQQQDERATQQFRQADTDRDGTINFKEFVAYCHGNCASRARLELRSTLGPSIESELLACISLMQTIRQKRIQVTL